MRGILKIVIIDEEENEVVYLNIPFNKIKMDSDVEPDCSQCGRTLTINCIVYVSEDINCDLCSKCFKGLQKSLSTFSEKEKGN